MSEEGNAKQAWLRDGRAYLPSPRELARLHEMSDALIDTYLAANAAHGGQEH